MNTHNNARLTPRGREQMVRAVVENGLPNAATGKKKSRPSLLERLSFVSSVVLKRSFRTGSEHRT